MKNFMSTTFTIFTKETKSYFYSPLAYVIIGLFIFMSSIIFYFTNLQMAVSRLDMIFSDILFALILLMFTSILTMRIYAEDKKGGTEVLLLTSPTSVPSIVLGKFLAAYLVFVVMTALTVIYPVIIMIFNGSFNMQMVGTYISFLVFGSCLISFGVFTSTLTESQIISAIISFIVMLIFLIFGYFSALFGGVVSKVIDWMDLYTRYQDSLKGVLSLSSIVYLLSFTVVILFSSVMVIEKKRWSQG
jgi:ABC-2 type transport system permease protein